MGGHINEVSLYHMLIIIDIKYEIKISSYVVAYALYELKTVIYLLGHQRRKPSLKELMRYSNSMTTCWRRVALELDIPMEEVDKIGIDHQTVEDKCYSVFTTWFKILTNDKLCWCQIVNAFKMAGLNDIAEQVTKSHLRKLIIIL